MVLIEVLWLMNYPRSSSFPMNFQVVNSQVRLREEPVSEAGAPGAPDPRHVLLPPHHLNLLHASAAARARAEDLVADVQVALAILDAAASCIRCSVAHWRHVL